LPADRWAQTASGPAGPRGAPVVLTWSFVPDATPLAQGGGSALHAAASRVFPADAAAQPSGEPPWHAPFAASFARWSALGGALLEYEPADDGAPHQRFAGQRGVRGDIRLAAGPIDGPGGTLASSQFPDTGDIVLDTDDAAWWSHPAGDYRRLRNVLMHEIGHALGLDHVVSSDAAWLMEPVLNLTFDGPQLDDVRGLHYLYGDRPDRAAGSAGNDAPATATWLGALAPGDRLAAGVSAERGLRVEPPEADFVSLAGRSDVDFYRLRVSTPLRLAATVVPWGGTFRQAGATGAESVVDAFAGNDLALALWDDRGTVLAAVDEGSRGAAETLRSAPLAAGDYFLRVSGRREVVQLYALRVAGIAIPEPPVAGALWAVVATGAGIRRRAALLGRLRQPFGAARDAARRAVS